MQRIFFERLDFKDNIVLKFFIDCSDENEWKRRHTQRIQNPLPHQSFKSFEHVVEHSKNADANSFADEYIIDSADTLEKSFEEINKVIISFM